MEWGKGRHTNAPSPCLSFHSPHNSLEIDEIIHTHSGLSSPADLETLSHKLPSSASKEEESYSLLGWGGDQVLGAKGVRGAGQIG